MTAYEEFLESKTIASKSSGFETCPQISDVLFPFQRDIVRFALTRGRSAIFAGTGLGKTLMQCEWSNKVDKRIIILAPLAVASQTIEEAHNHLDLSIPFCEDDSDIKDSKIVISNYQKLHRFDVSQFDGVVLDESSIIKHQDAKTRDLLIEAFAATPWKLCCTATPAPNDFMELGNHAEFLNVMRMQEMLSMFFVHDGGETQKWRLKGHAKDAFWKWVASWAVSITKPSDLGYEDGDFKLPPLRYHVHRVTGNHESEGLLFAMPAVSLDEFRSAKRGSLPERCELAAKLAGDDVALIWGELNDETSTVAKLLPNAVEVCGSDTDEHKSETMMGFTNGTVKQLVSKSSLCGFGMNWQHCQKVIYIGISHSWERFFQSVRRCWRFGQKNPVDVHIIISDLEENLLNDLWRKEKDAAEMTKQMIDCVKDETIKELKGSKTNQKSTYKTKKTEGRTFTAYLGDCVEVVKSLADDSIDYSIFSPPFSSLYTYSNSDRDMGNCKDYDTFALHFGYLVRDLFRVIKPGREISFHCMNLPTSKQHDGFIGIRDFRGELIRLCVENGFYYHSEVCIWKDPVTAMQRTKAIGLLHKQLKKDSALSRQGIPDYMVTVRKPGVNPNPVTHTNESFPVGYWQKIASPVWMDINPSDTLQHRSVREHADERHICPTQLEAIRRCVQLWTNPGDLILSPFMGIGSEGYVAIEQGRRFIGVELKESYYKQSVANLQNKESENTLL